jgi:hypothetical protein
LSGARSEADAGAVHPEAPAGTVAKWLVSKGGGIRSYWRPDGKHLLFVAPQNTGRVIPFTVVLNWAAGLKK